MSAQFTISEERLERVLGLEPSRPVGGCDWLDEVARQFRAIANLPHGWDSYGSPPPDIRKLDAAWGLLTCLCQASDLPKPHVNPTPDGGVQFEWEEGERCFEIVVAGEAATYLFCDYHAGVEDSGVVFDEEPAAIVRYVERVTADTHSARDSTSRSKWFVESDNYVEALA
jgi:hypothetical protein